MINAYDVFAGSLWACIKRLVIKTGHKLCIFLILNVYKKNGEEKNNSGHLVFMEDVVRVVVP